MDPVVKQSGDYNITSKISKRGNPLIRYALYLSTVSAIRFNPVIKRYYTRKKNDGMKGNKLLIACSNIYHITSRPVHTLPFHIPTALLIIGAL